MNQTDGDNQGSTVNESGVIDLGTNVRDPETDDESGLGSDCESAMRIVIETA